VGRKLYVGNLPDSATEQDLADKFAAYGTVKSVKLITNYDTGRIRGFGFIEMMSEAEAHAAIESLNGTDYDGRPMKVNEARTLQKRYGGGHRGGGNRW
jgi:RNA recognition motif-containing protein